MEPGSAAAAHLAPVEVPDDAAIERWLTSLTDADLDDQQRIEQIRHLEDLKAKAAAAQAVLTADFAASQRAHHEEARVPSAQRGRGVGSQIGLARRESPHRGGQQVGFSVVLVREMPDTLAAMAAGVLSEHRAQILVRETACLSLEDRRTVDRELCSDLSRLEGWGNRRLAAEAQKLAAQLDAAAVVKRAAKAESERCVTIRPAPDTMTYVTMLLPVAQGVAVYAALGRHADQRRAAGDERSRGQIMADTAVELTTGQATATAVPIAVNLTISDEALLAGGKLPAWMAGHGHLPAGTARTLVATAIEQATATLRRLYVSPTTGSLTQMDSQARIFPAGLGMFIDLRDQTCRTPYCDAPIRHHDHIRAVLAGGPTTEHNGQGLCEGCDYAKQAPGWRAVPLEDNDRHTVEITTPTGHRHRTRAPDLPQPSALVDVLRFTPRESMLLERLLAG